MAVNNPETTHAARPHPGWVPGLTSTAFFMIVLDSVVVITALPPMQRDLHAGLASLQWTLTAYNIAFAAGITTAAAVGDRFGRRLSNGHNEPLVGVVTARHTPGGHPGPSAARRASAAGAGRALPGMRDAAFARDGTGDADLFAAMSTTAIMNAG
jgi:MFS family permease